MWFWIRNISLLVILGSLGYLLMTRPDFMLLRGNPSSAAEGFSNFYGKIRTSLADAEEQQQDGYRLLLPDTSDKLVRQLQQRSASVISLHENWRGTITDRRFRKGETIKTLLAGYAREEGIELYWTLPRDYIVKHYFQTNSSLIEAMHEIATAIAPDFESPVLAYFCPQERAAVLTDHEHEYLRRNCISANVKAARQAG
ncbi:TcpQ domain-containing protein [Chromatiaceae bacterium AAb-1]|nr:TcpQ domain-containing protein [Chromatiaceae bacterium AAb-1]